MTSVLLSLFMGYVLPPNGSICYFEDVKVEVIKPAIYDPNYVLVRDLETRKYYGVNASLLRGCE